MVIPNKEELENKLKLHFHKKWWFEVVVIENIYFRIFWQDFLIPKGFKSDCASVPIIARIFFSPFDLRWIFWAIMHDYFYRTQFIPKSIADYMFFEWLKTNNKFIVSYLFYQSVNLFWFVAWNRNSKNTERYPKAKYDLLKIICKGDY